MIVLVIKDEILFKAGKLTNFKTKKYIGELNNQFRKR